MKLTTGYSVIHILASLGLLAALAGWPVAGWFCLGSCLIRASLMFVQALGRHPV